jgi:hypothetical protein
VRVVTLTGVAGAGKTRLAIEVAGAFRRPHSQILRSNTETEENDRQRATQPMPTPTRRSWRSMAVASEAAAPRHINHHVRATAISPPPHMLRSDGAHCTTPIAPCSKVRIAQPKRKVRRVRRSLVISEGAFRVKGVSPEVSPLEGRVGLGGLGWPVRCGVSSVVAVARCALHGVSPECRVTVISSPRRGGHGVVWQPVRWTQSRGRPRQRWGP